MTNLIRQLALDILEGNTPSIIFNDKIETTNKLVSEIKNIINYNKKQIEWEIVLIVQFISNIPQGIINDTGNITKGNLNLIRFIGIKEKIDNISYKVLISNGDYLRFAYNNIFLRYVINRLAAPLYTIPAIIVKYRDLYFTSTSKVDVLTKIYNNESESDFTEFLLNIDCHGLSDILGSISKTSALGRFITGIIIINRDKFPTRCNKIADENVNGEVINTTKTSLSVPNMIAQKVDFVHIGSMHIGNTTYMYNKNIENSTSSDESSSESSSDESSTSSTESSSESSFDENSDSSTENNPSNDKGITNNPTENNPANDKSSSSDESSISSSENDITHNYIDYSERIAKRELYRSDIIIERTRVKDVEILINYLFQRIAIGESGYAYGYDIYYVIKKLLNLNANAKIYVAPYLLNKSFYNDNMYTKKIFDKIIVVPVNYNNLHQCVEYSDSAKRKLAKAIINNADYLNKLTDKGKTKVLEFLKTVKIKDRDTYLHIEMNNNTHSFDYLIHLANSQTPIILVMNEKMANKKILSEFKLLNIQGLKLKDIYYSGNYNELLMKPCLFQ